MSGEDLGKLGSKAERIEFMRQLIQSHKVQFESQNQILEDLRQKFMPSNFQEK